jgi:hypothetical protein
MAKLHDDWKVLPHGPLTEVAPGLLTVVGQIPMPLGHFPRRMTVAALSGKRTAIFSPIPLPDADMARIEALGAPAFLIVPNRAHRLDIRPFHGRYPKAKVITAVGARARVKEAVPVDATSADLGKRAELVRVAGFDEQELALIVRHTGGAVSLVVNDVIGNVRHPRGIGAWIMARLTGFGPKPRVPRIEKHLFLKDKQALAGQFRAWAGIEGLKRLIPSHGDIIANPSATLLRIADDLDG